MSDTTTAIPADVFDLAPDEIEAMGLTPAQVDGTACIFCSAELVSPILVGLITGQRPAYACVPCDRAHPHPAWCERREMVDFIGVDEPRIDYHARDLDDVTVRLNGQPASIGFDLVEETTSGRGAHVTMTVGSGDAALGSADLRRLADACRRAADALDHPEGIVTTDGARR